jgi:hypothetical protein
MLVVHHLVMILSVLLVPFVPIHPLLSHVQSESIGRLYLGLSAQLPTLKESCRGRTYLGLSAQLQTLKESCRDLFGSLSTAEDF